MNETNRPEASIDACSATVEIPESLYRSSSAADTFRYVEATGENVNPHLLGKKLKSLTSLVAAEQ